MKSVERFNLVLEAERQGDASVDQRLKAFLKLAKRAWSLECVECRAVDVATEGKATVSSNGKGTTARPHLPERFDMPPGRPEAFEDFPQSEKLPIDNN